MSSISVRTRLSAEEVERLDQIAQETRGTRSQSARLVIEIGLAELAKRPRKVSA